MNLQEMLSVIEQKSERELNKEQRAVITHETGPLWVIAGPGSGKSDVLVLRCLKLVCVDEVPPKSIILTTFTKKAAENVRERLASYKNYLDENDTELEKIDLSQVRVDTLHGLCKDIMEEYRYVEYQNYRLLDGIDQLLFVYEHSDLSSNSPRQEHLLLWREFHLLAEKYNLAAGYRWKKSNNYPPHRWIRANATVNLFNRIVEDQIDVSQMQTKNGIWGSLAGAYEAYRNSLEENKACDFAHLQLKFLEFLNSPSGNRFLMGDNSSDHPGISHVLVDEYQDTNPIQEKIYLQLTQCSPHNLCVVGDDDQALYRFRGGTVECMVNFDHACQSAWGTGIKVFKHPLSTNYRSHPKIVDWCDKYIQSFNVINQLGARVSHKPSLSPDPRWNNRQVERGCRIGNYPAVSYLRGQNNGDVAARFAEMVKGLLDNGVVKDPSQCVLLLRSTRVLPRSAGPYQKALEQQGFKVYNPRSRTFLEQPEIQTALGTLVKILDPDQKVLSRVTTKSVKETIEGWIQIYSDQAVQNSEFSSYVDRAINRIKQTPAGKTITQSADDGNAMSPATIQEVFYHMISLEPFVTWRRQDVEQSIRLGKLSQVLDSYCMLPFRGNIGSTRGNLQTDPDTAGVINPKQLNHLYYSLVGLLVSEGLNEPEDEEIICPQGSFPIMTVHQAKGLEFPFVFVPQLGVQKVKVGPDLQIEDTMRPFRNNPSSSGFNAQERAEQDQIRFFYVAYSRAIYSLVLLGTTHDLRNQGIGFGDNGRQWFTDEVELLEEEE